MRGAFLVALMLASAPLSARADDTPRCTLMGQMAVSMWLDMMGKLSSPDPSAVDPVLSRLANTTATFRALECNTAQLGAAMDCVMNQATDKKSPRLVARECMLQSGLMSK